jgi:hypothetical protein
LNGTVEASVALLGDVTMVVEFPHRKYKAVERAGCSGSGRRVQP